MKNLAVAETSALRAITKMRHPQNQLYNQSNELFYQKTGTTNTECTTLLTNSYPDLKIYRSLNHTAEQEKTKYPDSDFQSKRFMKNFFKIKYLITFAHSQH